MQCCFCPFNRHIALGNSISFPSNSEIVVAAARYQGRFIQSSELHSHRPHFVRHEIRGSWKNLVEKSRRTLSHGILKLFVREAKCFEDVCYDIVTFLVLLVLDRIKKTKIYRNAAKMPGHKALREK